MKMNQILSNVNEKNCNGRLSRLYKMRDDTSISIDNAIERANTIQENYFSKQYDEICKAINKLCEYRNSHDCLLEGDPGYEEF